MPTVQAIERNITAAKAAEEASVAAKATAKAAKQAAKPPSIPSNVEQAQQELAAGGTPVDIPARAYFNQSDYTVWKRRAFQGTGNWHATGYCSARGTRTDGCRFRNIGATARAGVA